MRERERKRERVGEGGRYKEIESAGERGRAGESGREREKESEREGEISVER